MTALGPPPRAHLTQAAMTGALILLLLFLLFWATAAAENLPAATPGFIRAYTPAHGIQSLISGLFWMGLLGAVLGASVLGIYGFARRLGRHGRA